jgi:hypothetical protein
LPANILQTIRRRIKRKGKEASKPEEIERKKGGNKLFLISIGEDEGNKHIIFLPSFP